MVPLEALLPSLSQAGWGKRWKRVLGDGLNVEGVFSCPKNFAEENLYLFDV